MAALVVKEHFDARKAMQLLSKAGELAENAQSKKVTVKHVEKAREDLENDPIVEYIKKIMPLQAQLSLASIYLISKSSPEHVIISGNVYDVYSEITGLIPEIRQLTNRRIGDYINELKEV